MGHMFREMSGTDSLIRAWENVVNKRSKPGIDHETISSYDRNLITNIRKLQFSLDYGMYQPQPVQMLHGNRPYGLMAIEDRIVAYALKEQLNRICGKYCIEHNYGYVEGRSAGDAIDYLNSTLSINTYVYRCDIKNFFESIPRKRLIKLLERYVEDEQLYRLTSMFIKQGIYEGGQIRNGEGLIPGSPVAPVLSNLYLYDFDCRQSERFPVYVRYSDDMLFADKQDISENKINTIADTLCQLGLSLNHNKSRRIPRKESFTYLGHNFTGGDCKEEEKCRIYGAQEEEKPSEKQKLKKYQPENQSVEKQEDWIKTWEEMGCTEFFYDDTEVALTREAEKLIDDKNYVLADQLIRDSREDVLETADDIGYDIYSELFYNPIYSYRIGSIDKNGVQDYSPIDIRNGKELWKYICTGKTIAVHPQNREKSDLFVIDLDVNKYVILQISDDALLFEKACSILRKSAFRLQSELENAGLRCYVENSGYKGYHIWMFMDTAVETDAFWKEIDAILEKAGLPSGCHMEKIPLLGEECIKLPLSVNLISGRKAHFETRDQEYPDQHLFLRDIQRNRSDHSNHSDCSNHSGNKNQSIYSHLEKRKNSSMEPVFQSRDLCKTQENQSEKSPLERTNQENGMSMLDAEGGHMVYSVEQQCELIGSIVKKARLTHYLTHFERNALLYVYGHMGKKGMRYLHEIMSETINYDKGITQKFIDRIKEFPVGCEKLGKRFPNLPCSKCQFGDYPLFYASPVIYAYMENPSEVSKPDIVDKEECKKKIDICIGNNQRKKLRQLLLELTEKRKQLEEDIKVCIEELSSCREESNGAAVVNGKQEDEIMTDESGIYLKLL